MSHDEEKYPHFMEVLDGLEFPVSKPEVILHAESRGAGEEILTQLQALPSSIYSGMDHLRREVGLIEHIPGQENLWASENEEDPRATTIA